MLVVSGATIKCALAVPPGTSVLNVIPTGPPIMAAGPPAATVADMVPFTNIPTFGMCMTPTNPAVATATTAASGVLTPVPCVPVVTSPWMPGSPTVNVGGKPALNMTSTCMCMWGGMITILQPGQLTVQVP
jgi:hypothetical protein